MSVGLAAVIAVAWFALIFWALAMVRSGTRRVTAPPAHPRRRVVDFDVSDIEWDWKNEEAA